MASFGDKLKKIRVDRDMSQEEMGELLGTSKQVISRYETNKRTPKITIVEEYAKKLNVPLDYLINNSVTTIQEVLMSEDTMNAIISRVKSRRIELDYSFQDLADLTGMSKSTLQRYETGGIKNIPLDKLKILAKALHVTPEWIMGWEDKPAKQSDLPPLTAKDEREIARDLEAMINALDSKSGMAAYNEPEDAEDAELLKASLLTSMRLAKQIAKKKFTPHKYRKE